MKDTAVLKGTPREQLAKFDESTVMLELSKRNTQHEERTTQLYDELADNGKNLDEKERNRFVQYY